MNRLSCNGPPQAAVLLEELLEKLIHLVKVLKPKERVVSANSSSGCTQTMARQICGQFLLSVNQREIHEAILMIKEKNFYSKKNKREEFVSDFFFFWSKWLRACILYLI